RRFVDFTRTLRFRLTVWNAIVVVLTVLIALIAVRQGVNTSLLLELDKVLDDEVKEIILNFEKSYPDNEKIIGLLEDKDIAHQDRKWHIRWLDEDGRNTIWKSTFAPETPLTDLIGEMHGYKIYGSDIYRSIEREVDSPNVPRYKFRVGTPMECIDED